MRLHYANNDLQIAHNQMSKMNVMPLIFVKFCTVTVTHYGCKLQIVAFGSGVLKLVSKVECRKQFFTMCVNNCDALKYMYWEQRKDTLQLKASP